MAGSCSVCAHPDRAAIDDDLVSGVPYRDIVRRHATVPLTISSLSRHKREHVSPALKAVIVERAQAGAATAIERVDSLYQRASTILDAAETDGQGSMALSAIRELRSLVELLARLTGELDERPQVAVINMQSTPGWIDLRTQLMAALAAHPAALVAVSEALTAVPGIEAS